MNRGRKTKLTEAVLNKLRATEGKAYTDKTLAQIANVHPDTFSAWKAKASTAKSGIFYLFHLLLCDLEASLEVRILDPWLDQIDNGNIRAIELAIRRHPRLREMFREEPIQAKTDLKIHEDTNIGRLIIADKELSELWTETLRRAKRSGTFVSSNKE